MPPRARGGPALTLHWAAVGTGVKECLSRLVTTSPPKIITFKSSQGSLAPWAEAFLPFLRARPPGPGTSAQYTPGATQMPETCPPSPRPPHPPRGCPEPAEGRGHRSLRWSLRLRGLQSLSVHPGMASRTLPSPPRGVSARHRPRCNYLCLLPLWTTSVQAVESLCSNSGLLGRTLNYLYRAGGTLRGRVPRAPLKVDF